MAISIYSPSGQRKTVETWELPQYLAQGYMFAHEFERRSSMTAGQRQVAEATAAIAQNLSPQTNQAISQSGVTITAPYVAGSGSGTNAGAGLLPELDMNIPMPSITRDKFDKLSAIVGSRYFALTAEGFFTYAYPGADEEALQWLMVTHKLSERDATFVLRNAEQALNAQAAGNFTPTPEAQAATQPGADDWLDDPLRRLLGGGGGGRGAALEPVYLKPDRRVVRDQVKALVTGLMGTTRFNDVEKLTDEYMAQHKRRWEYQNQIGGDERDPMQNVLEAVRGSDAYKRIHKLRPDNVDESAWVTQQISAVRSANTRVGAVEQIALNAAQVGATPSDAVALAGNSEFQALGRARAPQLIQDMANSAARLRGLL